MSKLDIQIGDNIAGAECFLSVRVNGEEYRIAYGDLQKYFANANPDMIERASCYYDEANVSVVAIYTVASGQGGGVLVWDVASKQITHVSDGSFAIKCAVHKGNVFTLRHISYYGHTPGLVLDSCGLNLKPNKNYRKYDLNVALDTDSNFNTNNYTLEFDGDVLRVGYKGNIQEIKIS